MDLTRVNENYKCISDSQIAFLDKVVKSKNEKNKITKVDVTSLYE